MNEEGRRRSNPTAGIKSAIIAPSQSAMVSVSNWSNHDHVWKKSLAKLNGSLRIIWKLSTACKSKNVTFN